MKIETVLFDFDGTLADTNELISRSHLAVLEEYYPGQYDKETVKAFNGPSLESVYGSLNQEESHTMIEKYRIYNAEYHDQLIRLFEGVEENLRLLKKEGVQMGIVSTKRNDVLWKGLTRLGLADFFDVVVGSEDYTYFKPNPEPIYVAMSKLNCKHGKTVMVGDNGHDIQAAKNAGIPGIFVGWSEKTVKEMDPYNPDLIVHSMDELSERILTSLGEKVSSL